METKQATETWAFNEDTGTITINGKPFLTADAKCEFETFGDFTTRALKATAALELLEIAKYVQTAIRVGSSLHVNGGFIDRLEATIARAEGAA